MENNTGDDIEDDLEEDQVIEEEEDLEEDSEEDSIDEEVESPKRIESRPKKEAYSTDRGRLMREVRIQTFRSSGPGGQHRNVTDSGVRIVHEPSGIVVTATESRSQGRNKEKAFERLIERLKESNRIEKTRIPTHKSRGTRERELDEKRRIHTKKRLRDRPDLED